MKKRHIILFVIIGLLCGLISLFITLYPLLSNYFAEKNKSTVHTAYTQTVDTMPASPVTLGGAFTEEAQESAEEDYYDLLNVLANGIMGYIEIPKISVYLPIYHSTHSDVLQLGVGHLTGSSLPVGGADTHTILAGHSGLDRLISGMCSICTFWMRRWRMRSTGSKPYCRRIPITSPSRRARTTAHS